MIPRSRNQVRYRVALWPSRLAAYPIAEIPIQAQEADNALDAAKLALKRQQVRSMGVIVVLSAEKQETFYDLVMQGKTAHYSDHKEAPRAVGVVPPFQSDEEGRSHHGA